MPRPAVQAALLPSRQRPSGPSTPSCTSTITAGSVRGQVAGRRGRPATQPPSAIVVGCPRRASSRCRACQLASATAVDEQPGVQVGRAGARPRAGTRRVPGSVGSSACTAKYGAPSASTPRKSRSPGGPPSRRRRPAPVRRSPPRPAPARRRHQHPGPLPGLRRATRRRCAVRRPVQTERERRPRPAGGHAGVTDAARGSTGVERRERARSTCRASPSTTVTALGRGEVAARPPRPRRRRVAARQPGGVLGEVVQAQAEAGVRAGQPGQAGLGGHAQLQRAEGVLAGLLQLVRLGRQAGQAAQLVERLQQGRAGHLGGHLGGDHQRRAGDRVLDERVRPVRVALVLADVLHPAGGEVAAEDQVGQLQRGVVGVRCAATAGSAMRSDDCTEPGRSTSSSGPGSSGGVGGSSTCSPAPVQPPSARSAAAIACSGSMSPTRTSVRAVRVQPRRRAGRSSWSAVDRLDLRPARASAPRTGGRRTSA